MCALEKSLCFFFLSFFFLSSPPSRILRSPCLARIPASRALRKWVPHSSGVPFSAVIYSSFMNPLLQPSPPPPLPPPGVSRRPFHFCRSLSEAAPRPLIRVTSLSRLFSLHRLYPNYPSLPPRRPSPFVGNAASRVLSNLSCQAFISSITDFFQAASTCCTATIDIMNSALLSLSISL